MKLSRMIKTTISISTSFSHEACIHIRTKQAMHGTENAGGESLSMLSGRDREKEIEGGTREMVHGGALVNGWGGRKTCGGCFVSWNKDEAGVRTRGKRGARLIPVISSVGRF